MRWVAAGSLLAGLSCLPGQAGAEVFRYDDGYYSHQVDVTRERVTVRERTRSGLRGDLTCPIGPGVTAPTRDGAFCVRFAKDRCTYTRVGGKGEAIHEQEWARLSSGTMDFCIEMGRPEAVKIRGLVNLLPERRTITFPDGHRYDGEFANDSIQGRGVMTSPNGDRYEGQWVAGNRHGRGTMSFANGQRYEGEWRQDKMTGRGVMTSPNGDRYEGELVDGARAGRGAMRFGTGVTYEGDWRDDRITGRGVMTWPNGARYEGDFIGGARSGRGSMRYGSGGQYEGEWRDNVANGYGIMIWASGQRYTGQWLNGNRHGRGTHITAPGQQIEGEWRDDKRVGPITSMAATGSAASAGSQAAPMQRQSGPQAVDGAAGVKANAARQAAEEAEFAGDLRGAFDQYVAAYRLGGIVQTTAAMRTRNESLARIALLAPKLPGLTIPDDADRHNRQAIELLKSARTPEDNDRAAQVLAQAADAAPWIPDLHLNRGLVLDKSGHPEAAIQALRVYLTLDPRASDRDAIVRKVAALEALADERKAWLPFTGTWSTGTMTQNVELRGRTLIVKVATPRAGGRYLPGETLMHGTIRGSRVQGKVYTRPVDADEVRCFGRDHERDAEGTIDSDILRIKWHAFTYNKATCQITASEWKTYQDMQARPQ